MTLTCLIISSRIDYITWWDTEGKILAVNDAEARDVKELGLTLQFIIAFVVGTISLFVGRKLNENKINMSVQ